MSRAQTATATKARAELLGRLGLPADTPDDVLAETQEHLADFLDSAPDDLRGWADRRRVEAERIQGLLEASDDDLIELLDARRTATAPAAPRTIPTWAKRLGALALVVAVIVGVYQIGKPPPPAAPVAPTAPTPAPAGAEPTPAPLDQARVDELTTRLQAEPGNTEVLYGLADVHYAAGDHAQAQGWLAKLLEVDPTHEEGLIAHGATAYNQGDVATAEQSWTKASELYPTNPEVFYDLGFLYMTTERTTEMRAAWDKVVELAPDSQWARTVQSHG